VSCDQSPAALDFLDKHVLAGANQLVSYLQEKTTGDVYYEDWYAALFFQEEEAEEEADDSDYTVHREPLEFWIISPDLARWFKERNALLTNEFGFWLWGRETSGQSILLDEIFQDTWKDVV
jgi:hypothetical protein